MSSQRYERVRTPPPASPLNHDCTPEGITSNNHHQVSANDAETPISPTIPNSPPPSFRSRASSPTSRHDAAVDQNLADTFDADGSDSDEENDGDDRQRLMRGTPASSSTDQMVTQRLEATTEAPRPIIERRPTHLPVFSQPTHQPSGRVYGGGSASDGVFANLSAKPETGEKQEEHPPVSNHVRF